MHFLALLPITKAKWSATSGKICNMYKCSLIIMYINYQFAKCSLILSLTITICIATVIDNKNENLTFVSIILY